MARRSYDYIIVGAGSAGCTLAYRLGADPDVRILVLEAGGWDRSPWIHIPLGWGKILTGRMFDWGYSAEAEANVGGRAVECARGKVVGGSSSTNAMAYVRGNPADFDRWAGGGLPEWAYANVEPYFRRMERWEQGAVDGRGADGPLTVQRCRYDDPLIGQFARAAVSAGHAWVDDYNTRNQKGFSRLQMTIALGRRASAARAYLRPAMARGNVDVVARAHVTRILFDGTSACGVEYLHDGKLNQVAAGREVLAAGGVINTPQLLMLSGIGAPEELASHNIPVRVESPGVGKNLQDHASVIVMYRRRSQSPFHRMMRVDRIALALAQAQFFGSGFASDVPGGLVGFLESRAGLACPDLQMLLTAAPLPAWPYFKPFKQPFSDGFACRAVLLHPGSRGAVSLNSADPMQAPRIRQNFLAADEDWQALRTAMRTIREIARQPALEEFTAAEIAPGEDAQSDEALNAFIRATAITVHHPAGTCKMGPEADPLTVVDTACRVRGVRNLRVIDASVMPDLTSGNINAPVIMIAEKIADHILGRELKSGLRGAPAVVYPAA